MPAKMGGGVKPYFKVCKLKYIFCLGTRVRDTGTDTGNRYAYIQGYGIRDTVCPAQQVHRYTGPQAHR